MFFVKVSQMWHILYQITITTPDSSCWKTCTGRQTYVYIAILIPTLIQCIPYTFQKVVWELEYEFISIVLKIQNSDKCNFLQNDAFLILIHKKYLNPIHFSHDL